TGNNPIAEGYKIMHGTEDVTDNYAITTRTGTLTIEPKAVTVTAQDKEFTYTGEAQSWPEYDVDGLVGNDAISAVVTGSITFPSESPVVNELTSYEFTTGTPGNYTVTTADGELTMTTASVEITIKAADDSKTYDGTALTNAEVTVTEGELLPGDTLVATATGSATNVADTEEGNNPIAEGYKIMHGTEDVTANYVITTEDGTLTIEPKAVTVTAKSEEFTYDGNAHSNNGYDVDGLVGNDAISAVVTGSITFPSESPVVNELTSYEFTAGTPGNYTVTTYDGELTMTTASVAITITAASDEWTYDGDAHQNTEVTVTSGTLLTGDELVAEATGSVTDVADTEEGNNPIKAGYKIMHGDEDVTANYVITTEDGTLTINPKEVTITAKDASKAYDGDPLTQPEFTASALETGDSHVFTVVMTDDSTITDVGTQPNVIATVDGVAVTTGTATAVGNYIVTTVDGELEITQDKTAIVITSATNEWTYDSKNHTDETYTVTYGGETVEAGALGKTFTLPNGDVLQIISTAAGVKNVSDNAAENNTYTFTVTRDGASTLGNYESITANVGTLTILPKAVTITADNANKAYDGTPLTQPNFAATDLEEGDEHVFEVVMTADSTITDVGTQPNVIATVDGVAVTTGKQTAVGNYLVTTADGQLTITKDEAEFVITSADHTWTYDSKNHTDETYTVTYKGTEVEAAADGKTFTLPNGDVLTITATAAGVTNVSDNAADNNTYTYVVKRGDVETTDNYKNVVTNIGDLVIEPKAVTITANDASKAYDGTALTEGGFTATALEEGDSHVFTVVMTADSTITDVGTQPNVIATVDGVAVTTGEQKAIGNYLVTTVNGTLEITQSEAEIVISSASNEWTYDGENHTDETYTVTYNGETVEPEEDGVTFILPNGDVITITPTAEGVTDVSDTAEDNNTFTYTVTRDGADTSANYNDLTTDPGTLAITPKLVKVTADDKTKVYGDADPELTATEEGVVEGDTLTYELYRDSGEDVGTYNISFNFPTEETDEADQPKGILGWLQRVFTPKTQTVTQGNYEIQFVDGEFEITPRPLTITAASDEKVYNGEPLTNPDYEITEGELLEGDSLESVTVTGSQTLVGSSANTPSDAKIVNAEGEDVTANYEVTYVDGTLTVTDDGVDPDDVVTKTHDGKTYQVGETIVFTISVTNIYDEEQTITIHEQEGVTLIAPKRDGVTIVDGNLVIEGVQPGETIEVKAEYTVTEEDALSGHFHNTVTVTFEGGNTYEDDDEVDHFAHMTVVKTVVNTPADGKVFRTGETIQYEITVTNDGTEVLTGITVTDELTGDEWTIEKLEVGETVTFKAEYTVTDKDAEAGSVTNVATAKGNDPDGDPETEGDEITTDTDFDKPKPPKTGDSNNLFGWTGMAGLAMAALAVLVATRKREEDAE
ncbi:MAG: LPXTG cell wall anchor domain-containing protein, partial [Firmicutes bacterium]|nr:LPXTG cell wall anchor domain-containing protein [Bacillota bacterium]